MASGSNAPFITNALVAWPPPPTRFGAASPPGTARNTRFSLAAHFVPPLPVTSPPASSISSFPGAAPLNGYGVPRAAYDPTSASGSSGSSTPVRSQSVRNKHKSYHHQQQRHLPPEPEHEHESRRDYPPPKAPLSPSQLGRIAQSFGIAVPRIGGDGATPFPSSSHNSGYAPPRSPISATLGGISPYAHQVGPNHVVAVIPPTRLLSLVPDEDAEAERMRRRRWRRGRLIPLQATLGAMLVAIAREFGLPSTTGISVYLNGTESRRASTSSLEDDTAGPEITPTTWTTFFAHAARQSMSPSTTPISTPRKRNPSAATFGAMMATATVPVDNMPQQNRVKSLSQSTDAGGPSRSVSSASASSFSPHTPASLGNMSTMPVFGTIEFDIDPTQARWLDAWIESGGPSRRLGPGAEIAAMRELTLVERLKDPRPKFLRQMEEERERAERLAAERASTEALEVARLAAEREEAEREAEQLRREVEEAERQAAQVRLEREDAEREAQRLEGERKREEREAEERRKEAERQLGDGKLNGSLNGSPWNQSTNVPGSPMNAGSTNAPSPTTRTLNVEDTDRELASRTSPATSVANVVIPTAPGMLSPTSPASSNEYRASGMIMADQLNTLEKSESKFDNLRLTAVVRDLSPRDIRFAQPRPRMGLAASPPVRMADLPARGSSMADLPSRGSSRLPYLRHSEVSAESSHSSPSPTNAPLPPAQWPAVPFKAGESPQSPGLHDYFQRANSSPLGPPVSHEYAARVKSAESAHRATHHGSMPVPINAMTERPRSGPPPKRPARPPTPDLTMPETVPHVLPLELLKHNSPTPPSVPVFANRPNSISLKSLARRASSKNLRPKERAHAYAIANSRGDYVPPQPHHPRQESNTSYTSYSSSKSRGDSIGSADDAQNVYQPFRSDEFGQLDQDAQSPHSAGHPHRKDGSFTSRFFSFGGRRARESEDRPMTIVHISNPISVTHNPVTAAELVSAAGGMSPGPLSSIAASPMSVSGPSMSGPSPISPQSLVSPNSLSANSHASTANLSPAAATPGSVVGFSTPNPSTSTLGPNDARMSGDEHRGSMPNSPTSPRHVRRKPVPGIEGERDSVYEE